VFNISLAVENFSYGCNESLPRLLVKGNSLALVALSSMSEAGFVNGAGADLEGFVPLVPIEADPTPQSLSSSLISFEVHDKERELQ